jgi:hypothetical protein
MCECVCECLKENFNSVSVVPCFILFVRVATGHYFYAKPICAKISFFQE